MLGLKDDEHTHLAYTSLSHVCYRTRSPSKVSLEHQKQYCMEKEHVNCPIFLNGGIQQGRIQKPFKAGVAEVATKVEVAPEPVEEITGLPQDEEKPFRTILFSPRLARVWEITGVMIFLMILLAAWWLFSNRDLFFPNHTPVQASIATTSIPTAIITNTEIFLPNKAMVAQLTTNPIVTDDAGLIITLTNTPTNTPSPTTSPTYTATPTTTVALETTSSFICTTPNGWVVYSVRIGESFAYYANYFNTTIEYLLEANCMQSNILVAGQQIYLPWTPYAATNTPTRTATRTQVIIHPSATRTFTPSPTFTSTHTTEPTFSATPTTIPPTSAATDTPFPAPTSTPVPTDSPTESPGG